jgi:hypothetical protein
VRVRVESGSFSPPSGRRGATEPYKELGAFSRITTTTRIPPSSEARSEVWLPASGWNGELQPAGGGFYGGALPYARMREILRRRLVCAYPTVSRYKGIGDRDDPANFTCR